MKQIYCLCIGASEEFITPAQVQGYWQRLCMDMVENADFSKEAISKLKWSIKDIEIGIAPYQSERVKQDMRDRAARFETKLGKVQAILKSYLVDPKIKETIEGLSESQGTDYIRDSLRKVYSTALAVKEHSLTPCDLEAPWQQAARKVLLERDFSDKALEQVKVSILGVDCGVRGSNTEAIEEKLASRVTQEGLATEYTESRSEHLSRRPDGFLNVKMDPEVKSIIESLSSKDSQQETVRKVAHIYSLPLGVSDRFSSPATLKGGWQTVAKKMLEEQDFSERSLSKLKWIASKAEIGLKAFETEKLRGAIQKRQYEISGVVKKCQTMTMEVDLDV
jgi:hypothetical protein